MLVFICGLGGSGGFIGRGGGPRPGRLKVGDDLVDGRGGLSLVGLDASFASIAASIICPLNFCALSFPIVRSVAADAFLKLFRVLEPPST